MNFRRPVLTTLIASMTAPLTLAMTMVASAAPHSHKKVAREVYAATDANEMQPGTAAMASEADMTPPRATFKAKAVTSATPAATAGFDTVPASQSEPIIQRLRIVEELIRKYGRAYDYRTHTLKDLQAIRNALQSTTAAPARRIAPTAAVAAPRPSKAPVANDSIATGQAAALQGSEETSDLKSLPDPIELDTTHVDPEEI